MAREVEWPEKSRGRRREGPERWSGQRSVVAREEKGPEKGRGQRPADVVG